MVIVLLFTVRLRCDTAALHLLWVQLETLPSHSPFPEATPAVKAGVCPVSVFLLLQLPTHSCWRYSLHFCINGILFYPSATWLFSRAVFSYCLLMHVKSSLSIIFTHCLYFFTKHFSFFMYSLTEEH